MLQDEEKIIANNVDDLKDQVNTDFHFQILEAQRPTWLMDSKGTLSSPYIQKPTLLCLNSHSTREMVTFGTASPSTRHREATSYVCVLMLMAVVMAHGTYAL